MILNFLFKSYFAIFLNKGDKGVAAAIFVLSVPLGLINSSLLLILLSFLSANIQFGSLSFGLIVAVVVFFTGMYLRSRFRFNYELLSRLNYDRYRSLFVIFALIFYLFSLVFFFISITWIFL